MLDRPRINGSGNEVTYHKMASSSIMMNKSADQCTNVYGHLCGTYNSRYTQSSLFQEAQLQIISEVINPSFFDRVKTDASGNLGVFYVDDASQIGLFDCVDVNVEPDRTMPGLSSFYISPSCTNCSALRHIHAPRLITLDETLRLLPETVYNLVKGHRTWWLPTTHEDMTIEYWVSTEQCREQSHAFKLVNLTDQLADNVFNTITTFYDVQYDFGVDQNTADRLILLVKSSMVDFIMNEATFLASNEIRSAVAARVNNIPVLFGGGQSILSPYCHVNMSLGDCLHYRWFTSVQSVVTGEHIPSPADLWSINGIEVNAIWSPFNRAVYIPYGIAQLPFYSTEWPEWMQMSTLGAVIAHEMGHAIDPGLEWSYSGWEEHSNPADEHAMSAFLTCLDRSFESAGASVSRANLTASENFADAVSARVISRYLRKQSTSILRDGLTLWGQTWCSAGSPHAMPLSTDPHSSPFQRVNATYRSLPAFYSAFVCNQEAGVLC